MKGKFRAFLLIFFCPFLYAQMILRGVVRDHGAEFLGNGADPVGNALVELTDQADPGRSCSAHTDQEGNYAITITADEAGYREGVTAALQNSPNPFKTTTVLCWQLSESADIRIDIHNILGQKIKTLAEGFQPEYAGQSVWDATDERGRRVPSGVYICSLISGRMQIHRKILLLDAGGDQISRVTAPVQARNAIGKTATNRFRLRITGNDIETYERQDLKITGNLILDAAVSRIALDTDGNVYKTVKIGDQWWTAENLRVTRYRNQDPIPERLDWKEWSGSPHSGARCVYENDESYANEYGYFYSWEAVNDNRNLAPRGWHVPTDEEWQTLADFLGGNSVAGGKMKEAGTSHWSSHNEDGKNESGFSALPAGYRDPGGYPYFPRGYYGIFWSSTESDWHFSWAPEYEYASDWILTYEFAELKQSVARKESGYSVRLVRDPSDSFLALNAVRCVIGRDSGSIGQFTIHSNTSWNVISDSPWLSVSPAVGSEDETVTLTATGENGSTGWRSAVITIRGTGVHDQTLTVLQVGFGSMTGNDGKTYRTIRIGGQTWMAENLKETKYRNGETIPEVADISAWKNLSTGARCAYQNDSAVAAVYGYLYNGIAVWDTRNLAPAGWHVPTHEEWKTLEKYLGMDPSNADMDLYRGTDQGGKLKETGISHWLDPNTGATNESGFSALPGGERRYINDPNDHDPSFYGLGAKACFWTPRDHVYEIGLTRSLSYRNSFVYQGYADQHSGLSVRLIQD